MEKTNVKKVLNKNRVLVTIILIVVLVYTTFTVYLLAKEPSDTYTVTEGTLYLEETVEGYIIRNEVVVQGENYKNGMEQIVSEGEKAAKGQDIFMYYSNNEEDLRDKIEELDQKIQEALENEDTTQYPAEIKSLEEQIDQKVQELESLTDLNVISEYKKDIESLVIKKAQIAGELSPSGSYIKELIEERRNYETQLNSGAEYLQAPISGVVSYKVDGLESVLTTTDFSTLSKEFLEGLDIKTGKVIATNQELGKVIDNFSCYIAVIMSSDKAKEAEVGDSVKVALSNEEEVSAEISYIKEENEEEVLIVLEVNQLTEELIMYRKISFDLIWWSYSGLKVPNQSILEIDGLNYVVRSRAGYLDKLLVKVLRQNEDYSIVTTYTTAELEELGYTTSEISTYKKISVYDEIILNPRVEDLE